MLDHAKNPGNARILVVLQSCRGVGILVPVLVLQVNDISLIYEVSNANSWTPSQVSPQVRFVDPIIHFTTIVPGFMSFEFGDVDNFFIIYVYLSFVFPQYFLWLGFAAGDKEVRCGENRWIREESLGAAQQGKALKATRQAKNFARVLSAQDVNLFELELRPWKQEEIPIEKLGQPM